MRLHPTWGAKMVELIEPLKHLAAIIEHHHQWYDGQGYPRGLRGSEIPLHSRIIALANAFDVMTSCNPYNSNPLDLKRACQELKRGSGTQFDPELVEILLKLLQAA